MASSAQASAAGAGKAMTLLRLIKIYMLTQLNQVAMIDDARILTRLLAAELP